MAKMYISKVNIDDLNAIQRMYSSIEDIRAQIQVAVFGEKSEASFLMCAHISSGSPGSWVVSFFAFNDTPVKIEDFSIKVEKLTTIKGIKAVVKQIKDSMDNHEQREKAEFLRLKAKFDK